MKKTLFTALLLCAMLSSYAQEKQYMSFFGDSTWSYRVTYVASQVNDWIADYQNNPPDSLIGLGVRTETFFYCFDKKDTITFYGTGDMYNVEYSNLYGTYFQGNDNCAFEEELSFPNNLLSLIKENSVRTILKEDRSKGRLYRNRYLICDMSLSEGDTFCLSGTCSEFREHLLPPSQQSLDIRIYMFVDSVRYIANRKVIYLSLLDHTNDFFFGTGNAGMLSNYNFSIRFIEGIGPTFGLPSRMCVFNNFWSSSYYYMFIAPYLPLLQCVHKDGVQVYSADDGLECNQTMVDVSDYNPISINIYPNPATQYVNLDFSTNEEMNGIVEITDMLGRTCKAQHAQGANCRIAVGNLPVGMYIITYTDKNRKITRKFMKE